MVTKRTPKLAAGRVRITPRSIELFKVMRGLENCSCVWGPRYYNHRRCASCDRWWKLQCELHRELKLPPWCWPVMEHPPSAPPYDEIEGEKIHQRYVAQRRAGGQLGRRWGNLRAAEASGGRGLSMHVSRLIVAMAGAVCKEL